MPFLAVLDEAAFSGLEDSRKADYVKNEKDNNYYLDLSGEEAAKLATPLVNEITRLKTHNEKVLGEKKTFQEKYQAYETLGKTPEELKTFLESNTPEDVKAIQQQYELKEKALAKQLLSAEESAKIAVEEATKAQNSAFDQLRSHIKRATVAELKSKYDLNDLADDVLSNRIAVMPKEEGSNEFVTRVIENGEIAYKAANFKTPAQLVEELHENKGFHGMFNAGTGGGTGGTNNQSRGNFGTPKTATKEQLKAMPPEQKREFYLNGGEQI